MKTRIALAGLVVALLPMTVMAAPAKMAHKKTAPRPCTSARSAT